MNSERRTDPRYDDQSVAFVELESELPESREPAKLALARTVNVSSHGMQIATKDELLPGRILRIFVDSGEDHPLTLVGEVKWCRPVEGEYWAGVEIYPSRDTAQIQWAKKVDQLSS